MLKRVVGGFLALYFVPLLKGEEKLFTEAPDWSVLDPFQKKITKSKFCKLLNEVYCPRKSWYSSWIEILNDRARIRKTGKLDSWYDLVFDNKENWESNFDFNKTFLNTRIALDPGHIGGKYSLMEGRHFSIGEDPPVREGEICLMVAKNLKEKLKAVGAEVFLVRKINEPVTKNRPEDFTKEATSWFENRNSQIGEKFSKEQKFKLIQKRKEVLFYRLSEIHSRARLVNESIKPDLVICLHINAAPWKDPDNPSLVQRNDYHVLVNGCYMGGEIADDFQRFEMIHRLMNGWHEKERLLAEEISYSFSKRTGLPAFVYKGPNAVKVGKVPGVWGRNLLANRIYSCPVVFLEPYVANSIEAYQHIQMGNYQGEKLVLGKLKKSIVEEYAESVFLGLKNIYGQSNL